MKALAVLCFFVLAALCVAEDGPFTLRLGFKCDMVLHQISIEDGVERRSVEKIHGNFSIAEESDRISLTRPDLGTDKGGYPVEFVEPKKGGCYEMKTIRNVYFVFNFREETTYNNHKCFRYYNDSTESIYADKDSVVWGIYFVEDSEYSWTNFSYPTEPHTPEMFKFNETSPCRAHELGQKALEAPNASFFYDMCMNDNASHVLSPLFLLVVAAVFAFLLF